MKPVVIIAISVGCSVAAVLAVLVGLEMYAVNEAQKAVAIELERQAVCERLYEGYAQSLRDTELWGICINYGIINAVNDEVSDCGRGSHYTTEMCRMDTKILAMQVVDQEITLDERFRESFTSDLNYLQQSRSDLINQRQLEVEQNKIKFVEMEHIEQQWVEKYDGLSPIQFYPIYQECLESEIRHYDTDFLQKQFCEKTLKKAVNEECFLGETRCNQIAEDVMKGMFSGEYFTRDTQDDMFSSYMKSCGDNPYTSTTDCICSSPMDSIRWHSMCKNWESSEHDSSESDFTEQKEMTLPPYEEPESFDVDSTLSHVSAQMVQCERNISESYCKEKLMSNIVQYCGTTQNKNSCISELIEKFTIPLQ